MSSSIGDPLKTYADTSSKDFSRRMKIVAERTRFYPLLREVIGAAVYINVAMASIVPTLLLQPREYGLITWADHLLWLSPIVPLLLKTP